LSLAGQVWNSFLESYYYFFSNPEKPGLRRKVLFCLLVYYLLFIISYIPSLYPVGTLVFGTLVGFFSLILVLLFDYSGFANALLVGIVNITAINFLPYLDTTFIVSAINFNVLFIISAAFIAVLSSNNRKTQEYLRRLSVIDELTGAYNYRYFFNRLEEEVSRAQRNGVSVALLVIDLDHFKYYNDNYGHRAGDSMLKASAENIRMLVRLNDIVCRYGGDEFVVILPDTEEEGAVEVASRLKDNFEAGINTPEGVDQTITISAGVAVYPVTASSAEDLIRCADRALYAAKNSGRNRIYSGSMIERK